MRDEGVYFVSDPSYHGWTHEGTSQVWDKPQDAAHDFICWRNRQDEEGRLALEGAARIVFADTK